MSGIEKVKEYSKQDAAYTLKAFEGTPGMQRLRKLFSEAPPPWPKVRDVPPEGP